MTASKPTRSSKRINFFSLNGLMYQSRWLLYPINCGLLFALLIYVTNFGWNIVRLVRDIPQLFSNHENASGELMIAMVSLLDQAMISGLFIITIMGSHQIYVRRFKYQDADDSPQWLDHIDTIMLKVKMGLAFVGVSSVLLLEDAISTHSVPDSRWLLHVYIHLIFLATTLVVAIVWRIMKTPLK
jgi:uncharacterized protein (TIGR00645 family)